MTRALLALLLFRFILLSSLISGPPGQGFVDLVSPARRMQEPLPTTQTPSPTAIPSLTQDPTSIPSTTLLDSIPAITPSDTETPTPSSSPAQASPSVSPSPGRSPGATPSSTALASPSPTPSPSPVPPAPTVTAGLVVINELGWARTIASALDEWIELYNTSSDPVALDGWRLTDEGDINISLWGAIAPFGYMLLERTDDSSVGDVTADIIYTGH